MISLILGTQRVASSSERSGSTSPTPERFSVGSACRPMHPAGRHRCHGRRPHWCQDIQGWAAPAPARPVATPSGSAVAHHDPAHRRRATGTSRREPASGAPPPDPDRTTTRPEQERRSGIGMTPQQVASASCPLLLRGPEVDPDSPLLPGVARRGLSRRWVQPTAPPDRSAERTRIDRPAPSPTRPR